MSRDMLVVLLSVISKAEEEPGKMVVGGGGTRGRWLWPEDGCMGGSLTAGMRGSSQEESRPAFVVVKQDGDGRG